MNVWIDLGGGDQAALLEVVETASGGPATADGTHDVPPEVRDRILEFNQSLQRRDEAYDARSDSDRTGFESPSEVDVITRILLDVSGDVATGVIAAWLYDQISSHEIDVVEIGGERITASKEALLSFLDARFEGDS